MEALGRIQAGEQFSQVQEMHEIQSTCVTQALWSSEDTRNHHKQQSSDHDGPQVAAQMSEDKARQGGALGWKTRQDVVGAFADAAFQLGVSTWVTESVQYELIRSLTGSSQIISQSVLTLQSCWLMQVGDMTQAPVKTQFGYHLILCEGRK